MKYLSLLGSLLFFASITLAAQPRVVQTSVAKSPDQICLPNCPNTPDQLTITFSPTTAGNPLFLIFFGGADFFNAAARTCTDNSGQQWFGEQADGRELTTWYYQPGAFTGGLTSVSCVGEVTGSSLFPPNSGVSGMLFFEMSGVNGPNFFDDSITFSLTNPNTNPVYCQIASVTPELGLQLFFVEGGTAGQNPITFTPQSPNIQFLTAVNEFSSNVDGSGTATGASFYGINLPQYPVFSPSAVLTGNAVCYTVVFPISNVLDPVPDLMNGSVVTKPTDIVGQGVGADKLATLGRPVQGVAADGATQVLIRVPAANVGDQFTVTVLNDQHSPSALPAEDGALGNPGDASVNITSSQISVTAVNSASGPFAFAVYRAPIDFARDRGQDNNAASRPITVEVSGNTGTTDFPITIVRPPLALIHGIWSDSHAWDKFSPLVAAANTVDARFSVLRVNYDLPIGTLVTASNPPYFIDKLRNASSNSLGFAFNAPLVFAQMSAWLRGFKTGSNGNPILLPVAAAQFDVVAHSMGGDISLTLPLLRSFVDDSNFGMGTVHKLITIDTPHQGTPVAGLMLAPENDCTRRWLSKKRLFAFTTATLVSGVVAPGAVGDLNLGSQALQAIHGQGVSIPPNTAPLATALIAGEYTNWTSLSDTSAASVLDGVCFTDTLPQALTPTGWPAEFQASGDSRNDGLVSVASQLNAMGNSAGSINQNFVHSTALEGRLRLGFTPPSVLDANTVISNQVIQLLNTPVSSSVFQLIGPTNLP